jgi:hypothetical protein
MDAADLDGLSFAMLPRLIETQRQIGMLLSDFASTSMDRGDDTRPIYLGIKSAKGSI